MSSIGTLTISLDAELAWGRIAAAERSDFDPLFADTRKVVERLLGLLDRYEIPVTWALVGRMIESEEHYEREARIDLSRYFGDRVDETCYEDPVLNPSENSFLRYVDLVARIRGAKVVHELASHSYNHCFFGEIGDPKLIQSDFDSMKSTCAEHGFEPESLVFPKNQVAYLDLLALNDVRVYRSPDRSWFSSAPRALRSLLRQVDNLLPIPVSLVEPELDEHGLTALPGSLLFRREHRGVRRHIPITLLRAKAVAGLKRASHRGGTVHLWFHPFNFAFRPERHFAEFEKVLRFANELRAAGRLRVRTMAEHRLLPASGRSAG